jgi:hypothetical protein
LSYGAFLFSDTKHGHGHGNTNGLKGDQKKMRKKNRATATFILFVLLALVFWLQGLGNHVQEAYSERKVEKQRNYPSTPEGVVRAFVQATFDGESHEVIGDERKGLRYTTWGDRYPSSDVDCIALRYDVTRWMEAPEKVTVKVVYQSIGVLSVGDDSEEEAGERTVFEKVIYYELLSEKSHWKISSPANAGCISVNTGIKILQHEIDYYKDEPKRIEGFKKKINILRKYL